MQLQSVTQPNTMMKSTMTETVRAVLRSRRNCSNDGAERTDDRRAFHARAAVTEKARSPSVVRRVVGMTSVDLEALRRRRREPASAVERRVSATYDGAVPIRQRYARTHNRNWILSGTFSQCSSRRSGVICDPMWHVSSRSGVATLRTAIHLLLTYLQ